MSVVSNLRPEDQFLCSICLDVFTNPVTTPCGHNFCKHCITRHWDINVRCMCPLCNKLFKRRPELDINTLFSEVVVQFRHETQQKASSSSSVQQAAKPGEVPCDICTGTKLRALKSCLVCLTSYCKTHLEPHLTMKGLKRHQLIEPVENLEGRMCTKHNKHLELFCKTDQTCVCVLCSVLDHRTHEFIPLREESEEKKAELRKTDDEIQQMIEKRRRKIQEIKESLKMSKDAADRAKTEGFQIFAAVKESLEKGLKKLIKEIEDKQGTTEKQAEDLIKKLEQEISELKKRSSELKQVSRSEDHLHLLQSFSSLKAVPLTKDWTEVIVLHPTYVGTVMRGLLTMTQLLETHKKNIKKLIAEAELRRVQQYAVDVSLDPDTAHPELILSDDGKQVNHGHEKQNLPENPKRFKVFTNVLGRQGFSSGRFYFEVQVKGKTDWILGVARESVNRNGDTVKPQNGFWALWLRNKNEYTACTGPAAVLSLQHAPDKVGVFVDYEKCLVSFYDVDAAALIYSFTGCSFTEKLYPYFNPCNIDNGENSAPLLITPINPIN